MTTTFDQTLAHQSPTEERCLTGSTEKASLPRLFWPALILFIVNLFILCYLWLSPDTTVRRKGQEHVVLSDASSRPSPFTERVQIRAARKVKQPEKVYPVLYSEPAGLDSAESNLPLSSSAGDFSGQP